ncbi:MAG: hypothetical protein ACRERE_23405 [Candidatus Entotheonellia bacterium]
MGSVTAVAGEYPSIRTISLEVEEPEVSRAQVLHVSVSYEGGQTYQELRRQEYTCSPPGTTFEREEREVTIGGVPTSNW